MPPTDLNPTARALVALETIQSAPGISGSDLAARLGVSDRAARRYVGVLRDAGMPVESTSGRYGGYRIGRGARIPPLMFSPAEAVELVMAVLRGWHGPVESEQPAATALAKIVRVLPAPVAAPVEALRHVVAQNPADAQASPDAAVATAVVQACEARHRVRLGYRTPRGHDRELPVDLWAVVVRHGRWYVLCWSYAADARRVLRLDRVTRVEPTGETAVVPAGLDALELVEEHLADGWTYPVEVRIEAPYDAAARCTPRALGRLTALDADSCTLRGSTDEPTWYAAQLATVPFPFTVVSSDEVVAALRVLADRLTRAAEAPERAT